MSPTLRLSFLFGLRHTCGARKLVIAALLALLPGAVVLTVRCVAPPGQGSEAMRAAAPNLCLAVTSLLSLFLGSGCVRDLLEERTLSLLLTRPVSRRVLASGLLFSAAGLAVLFAAFAGCLSYLVADAGATASWTPVREIGAMDPRGTVVIVTEPSVVLLICALSILAFVHTTLFGLIGLHFRRSTVLGVVWLFVIEAGLGSIPGPARMLSPVAMVEGLLTPAFLTRASVSEIGMEYDVSGANALVVLSIMLAVLIALYLRRAARMDFLPHEQESASS